MRTRKRLLSLLLCGAMLFSLCSPSAFAEAQTTQDSGQITVNADGLCEHHTEHDEGCGYSEGEPETLCAHEHSEDCYKLMEECTYQHTADCYPVESVSDNTATPSNAEEREPENCEHICSEDSGCITEKLDCQHEHNDECGYSPATESTPCGYICQICNGDVPPPDEAAKIVEQAQRLSNAPEVSIADGPVRIDDAGGPSCPGHIITGTSSANTITVTNGTHNITLQDVNIDVSGQAGEAAFSISSGATVHLTLVGDNHLKSGGNCAGLQVPKGAELVITENSRDGSLNATGGSYGAGIGGGDGGDGGTITINGGKVNATGGTYGAGIGGGDGGAGGKIIISGGTVKTTSEYGAGIGGGDGGDGGTITINGGKVNATGGTYGAGIGGGDGGAGGKIIISGGTVKTTSEYGAGIGGGGGGAGGKGAALALEIPEQHNRIPL